MEDQTPPQGLGVERARLLRRWRRRLGLTQEEVAAGIGVTTSWYASFERGSPANYSDDFLYRVARQLRLNAHERELLHLLTGRRPPPPSTGARVAPDADLIALVSGLPWPACLCDEVWDVVAVNDHARAWRPWLGEDRPNLMRHLFADPDAHEAISGWDTEWAPRAVEELRLCYARYPRNPRLQAVIRDVLRVSRDARALWEAPSPGVPTSFDGGQVTVHVRDGDPVLHLAVTVLTPRRDQALSLLVATPA